MSEKFERIKKERDHHRLHHLRLDQEKIKLTEESKRLKKENANHEPVVQQLQNKVEVVVKEKIMARMERDKLVYKVIYADLSHIKPLLL
jgi:hypothetical protein